MQEDEQKTQPVLWLSPSRQTPPQEQNNDVTLEGTEGTVCSTKALGMLETNLDLIRFQTKVHTLQVLESDAQGSFRKPFNKDMCKRKENKERECVCECVFQQDTK